MSEVKKDFLEFDLTKTELDERNKSLLAELDNNDRIISEAADVAAQYKSQLKTSDTKILKLRNAIKDGKELFEVEISFNEPKDGKKTIKRKDTGKKLVVDMTEDEIDEHSQVEMSI